MSDKNETDRKNTEELYDFLQGTIPDGYSIEPSHIPHLTPDQAWTVIWYLGNKYWQVTDRVARCEICGAIYNEWCEGECLDGGPAPYHFCGNCLDGEEAQQKRRLLRRLEKAESRKRPLANTRDDRTPRP